MHRYQLFYSEEYISKIKTDNIKTLMGDSVIIPNIDDKTSYVYLKEGELKNETILTTKYGLKSTNSYEDYENIKMFVDKLDLHDFAVGDTVCVKSYANLNFTAISIDDDMVVVKPHLRFNSNEFVFHISDIIKPSLNAKSYDVVFKDNYKTISIDINYLDSLGLLDDVSSLFLFIIRLKLQFKGCNVVFFNGENDIVNTLNKYFKFHVFPDEIPVSTYYFTDKWFLIYNCDFVIYMDNNNILTLNEKCGVNYKTRYVVEQLIKKNIIKEIVSSDTMNLIIKGDDETLRKKLHKYSLDIDKETDHINNMQFHFTNNVHNRLTISDFKKFVDDFELAWVNNNLDYYYNAIYK